MQLTVLDYMMALYDPAYAKALRVLHELDAEAKALFDPNDDEMSRPEGFVHYDGVQQAQQPKESE